MANIMVHFSSRSDEWRTPEELYKNLNKEFGFDFDPCPFGGGDFNGLEVEWGKVNFVNPPYSKIKDWARKSYTEYISGKTVVMLIPSRTDTSWWHDYIMKAKEIRFIRGRLRFSGSKNNAPFPSCIVVFRR